MSLERVSILLDRIGRGLAAVCCAIMFLFLMADIVLRNFGIAFLWPIEYSGFLMAFIVFLPLAGVTRRREHMAADFFLNAIGGPVESSFRRALIPIANFLFATALLYLAFETTAGNLRDGTNSMGPLRTPMWIPQTVMVAALLAMVVTSLIDLLRWSDARPPSELDQVKPIDDVLVAEQAGNAGRRP
ncbi:MAG: TRAP transporter small permease [Hyphomicrobiaceae bacterium]|nr:TRAP transporter small permease [Hyphomicrobiaceae bacterium]